ncbi:MAG: hypothetical protein EXR21_07030 [Flavobacteriaceae bacterium]|nr:hypothetical protein [Flavobacteriaceae bacterium]
MKKYGLTIVLIVLVSSTIMVMLEMDKDREHRNKQPAQPKVAYLYGGTMEYYRIGGNDSIAFNTGFFSKEKAKTIGSPDPKKFIEQFYNSGLGYIFYVKNPNKYGLTYDSRHKKISDYPATLVRAGDSIVFEVTKAELNETIDIETYLNTYLLAALYDDKPKPRVMFDYTSQMGFFKGFHKYYGEAILTKVYMDNKTAFVAMLRFPERLSKDVRVKDLSTAVTSFSLIK